MTPRLLLLALAGLLAAGCGESSGQPGASKTAPPGPDAVAPAVITPEYQTRVAVVETTGKVQFNEDALARVHAPATGRVIEVFARPGEVVERGARLLVFDSADLGAAKTDYAKAVADLEHAEAALRLARELFEVKAVAQKEIRDAENDAQKAVSERERCAARLETLGVGRDHLKEIASRADASTTITLTAPRSGVVVERNVAPGQVVAYGQSDTPVNLFVIADLSTVWVVADVYEPDVPRLRRGETMTVTLRCCPGERYEGPVSYIADAVDKDTRTVKVRAVVPNRGRSLKAEMFVNVSLATGTLRVLTLPQDAVHRDGSATYVLVATGPQSRERRSVRLGADLGDRVEVLEGIGPEDRVVGRGSILLKSTTK
jgi:cobalt-zinc-cadmium efflux system membrane fusion protein